MTPISVGLAGFGTGGRLFHAPFLSANPSFSLDFIYERTADRARSLYPNAKQVRSFEELLTSSCSLIVIALPNVLHAPCVKAALEAGKHVVCDKPLCESSCEALELFSMAESRGLVLSVYQNRRFDSEIQTLKIIREQNILGELKDVTLCMDRSQKGKNPKAWKSIPGELTGIHYDLGIHLLDSAYYLFGMPSEIYCSLRTLHSWNTVPDRMEIELSYPNQLRVRLCASQCARIPSPCLVAHGILGSYVKSGCDLQESMLNQSLTPLSPQWRKESPAEWGRLCTLEQTESHYPSVDGDYGRYYRLLAQGITKKEAVVSAKEAAKVLTMLEAAVASSETKKVIKL